MDAAAIKEILLARLETLDKQRADYIRNGNRICAAGTTIAIAELQLFAKACGILEGSKDG